MRQMNASTLYTIFKNPKGVPMMKIHKDEQYRLKQVEMCSVTAAHEYLAEAFLHIGEEELARQHQDIADDLRNGNEN